MTLLLFLLSAVTAHATVGWAGPMNRYVLQAVNEMPTSGGRYSTAFTGMEAAMENGDGTSLPRAAGAKLNRSGFCSACTFAVFLTALNLAQKQLRLTVSPAMATGLQFTHQVDGDGWWGSWNANGPGTAVFMQETRIGANFTVSRDPAEMMTELKPGDFLKISWNGKVGAEESGHSVVVLETKSGKDLLKLHPEGVAAWDRPSKSLVMAPVDPLDAYVKTWSCNMPDAMSVRWVPLKKIPFGIASRLYDPAKVFAALNETRFTGSNYLRSLLKVRSSPGEAQRASGISPVLDR